MKSHSKQSFITPWNVLEIELPAGRARPAWRWVAAPAGGFFTSRLPSARRLLDEARNLGAMLPEESLNESQFVQWLDDKARSISRVTRIEQTINKLIFPETHGTQSNPRFEGLAWLIATRINAFSMLHSQSKALLPFLMVGMLEGAAIGRRPIHSLWQRAERVGFSPCEWNVLRRWPDHREFATRVRSLVTSGCGLTGLYSEARGVIRWLSWSELRMGPGRRYRPFPVFTDRVEHDGHRAHRIQHEAHFLRETWQFCWRPAVKIAHLRAGVVVMYAVIAPGGPSNQALVLLEANPETASWTATIYMDRRFFSGVEASPPMTEFASWLAGQVERKVAGALPRAEYRPTVDGLSTTKLIGCNRKNSRSNR